MAESSLRNQRVPSSFTIFPFWNKADLTPLGEAKHDRNLHQTGKPQCPGLAQGDSVKRLGGTRGCPCVRAALHHASDPRQNTEGGHMEGNRVQGAKDEAQAVVPKLDIKKHGAGLDLSGKQLSQR